MKFIFADAIQEVSSLWILHKMALFFQILKPQISLFFRNKWLKIYLQLIKKL